MIRDVAAKRYAEAAYLIAREDEREDAWQQGLTDMAELFGSPNAQAFLENTRVPAAEKLRLVEKVLFGVDPLVINLARLLLRRGKTAIASQVKEAFQELMDEAQGISHATVTSAIPLEPDELTAVRDKLGEISGGPVTVQTLVDESILGGLVVRIGDRLIDGSTKSRLLALKRQLAEGRA